MLVEQDKHGVNAGLYKVEVALAHIDRLEPVLNLFPALAGLRHTIVAITVIITVPALGVCPFLVAVPAKIRL